MPGTELSIDARLERIEASIARMERAILGDPSVGHQGLVTRVERLEVHDKEATDAHYAIDQRRSDGDRKLHERVDEIAGDWSRAKATLLGLAIGVSVAGGFGGTWLFNAAFGG